MSRMIEQDIKVDIEVGDVYVYQVKFIRKSYWVTDNNCGADADGRRGTKVTYMEEDRADELRVLFGSKYIPIQEVNAQTRIEIEEAVAEWLEANDPEEVRE